MTILARLRGTIIGITLARDWVTFFIILKCSCICSFTLFLEQSMFFAFVGGADVICHHPTKEEADN